MGTRKVSKMWFMALLLVVFVAGCGREQGALAPTLSSISPNRGIQGQALGVTLTGTNFATGATVNVSGTLVTVSSTTVVSNTQITATFTIDKTAAVGDRAVSVTSSGMITNAVTFTVAPPLTVSSTLPANGAVGVAVNQSLTATLSEALDCSTVTPSTFTVTGPGGTAVVGTITCSGTTATFKPTSILASNTVYTATLTTGITDSEGDPLASNFVWSFTTAPAPTVISTIPINGTTGVPIDQPLTATFSQGMTCSTITISTFTVTGPAGGVPGTIACLGTIATFTPSSSLASNTTYTATITTGVTNVAGAALASNFVWTFKTGSASGATPPTVTAVAPLNNATGVALNTAITAMFDQAMAPATMSTSTFTLTGPGTTSVSGAVTYTTINNIVTFAPTSNLAAETVYTATVTTGVTNLAGTAMAANFVWAFKTGAAPDTTPPTVISTNPVNLATGVPLNQAITATFSEAMKDTTINTTTFTLAQGATPVPGVVTYSAVGNTATFITTGSLVTDTVYTATITSGVSDLAGNHLASNYVWSFTTTAPVIIAPTVLSTSPASNASGVCPNAVNATFSTAMDPATINTATFTVTVGGLPVTGTISLDVTGTIATFTPLSNLATGTFTATITTGVTDLAGNALASDYVWSFTTGPACLAPVPLGAAAPFGGFGGGAGMTNQGINTVINGDIGTTGVSTTMTGFHDTTVPYIQFSAGCIYTETTLNVGTVNGEIFTAAPPPTTLTCPNEGTAATMAIATQAAADALIAYDALAALPGGADPGSGQLGGLVLAPGTYTSVSGTFLLTGSDLTLNAQGNANAVWVFQMASSLTVGAAGAPRSVILVNGAQAKNVFWQVGAAATINGAGGGTMVGTIIAKAGITFSTAGNAAITTLNGRALALNASVTMVNTVINVPAP